MYSICVFRLYSFSEAVYTLYSQNLKIVNIKIDIIR